MLQDAFAGHNTSSSIPNRLFNFSQEDICHANEIQQFTYILPNAGQSPEGGPVSIFYTHGSLFQELYNNPEFGRMFLEHVTEVLVRRQIQLELLSRAQRRVVMVVAVADSGGQPVGAYLSALPGPARDIFTRWMYLAASMGTTKSKLYWLSDSWVVQKLLPTFLNFSRKRSYKLYVCGKQSPEDSAVIRQGIGTTAVSREDILHMFSHFILSCRHTR